MILVLKGTVNLKNKKNHPQVVTKKFFQWNTKGVIFKNVLVTHFHVITIYGASSF